MPPHVPAERLPHLESEPADMALVAGSRRRRLRRRVLCGSLMLGRRRRGGHPEREAVAAAQVAGAVAAERLERGEGAAARLADELALAAAGRAARPLAGAAFAGGRAAEGERQGEGHVAGGGVSRVLRHGRRNEVLGSDGELKILDEEAANQARIGSAGGLDDELLLGLARAWLAFIYTAGSAGREGAAG